MQKETLQEIRKSRARKYFEHHISCPDAVYILVERFNTEWNIDTHGNTTLNYSTNVSGARRATQAIAEHENISLREAAEKAPRRYGKIDSFAVLIRWAKALGVPTHQRVDFACKYAGNYGHGGLIAKDFYSYARQLAG